MFYKVCILKTKLKFQPNRNNAEQGLLNNNIMEYTELRIDMSQR